MRRYWAYLKYVLAHKWWVIVASRRIGASLWLALIHDASKFGPSEWSAYAHNFFSADGLRRNVRRPDGGYDPNLRPEDFQYAWLSHQRNKHHWQRWVSIGDSGTLSAVPMPSKYVLEMVADWMGAGRAITGRWECGEWYAKNRDTMVLHDVTRSLVESVLAKAFGGKETTK